MSKTTTKKTSGPYHFRCGDCLMRLVSPSSDGLEEVSRTHKESCKVHGCRVWKWVDHEPTIVLLPS
jgi:hypothetical protein